MTDSAGTDLRARWRGFYILAAAEAVIAFLALAVVPREAHGFSPARLGLLALLGALGAFWLLCALRPPRPAPFFSTPLAMHLFGSLAVLAGASLFVLRYLNPPLLQPYFVRLGLLLWYFVFLGIQVIVLVLWNQYGIDLEAAAKAKSLLRPTALALGALLVALVFVAVTRLGLMPDPAYWGEPGVPVMGWQLVVAILAGLAVLVVSIDFARPDVHDLWIAAAVWLLAAVLWLSVPVSVMRNSFYEPITAPVYQAFPNSDAGYYDSMAQSLLIGYPYQGQIPARPLYVVFLAALHLVFGERYASIIAGQTLVLALIPVALYLLGTRLHSRVAGVTIALIAIFRELNSLLVSSHTRVSNTKTLLVDLPTLLLMVAACLLTLRWFQTRRERTALVAGGLFGALLLLRTQAAFILPFVLALSIPVYGGLDRLWRRAVALFVGALIVTLVPWLLHNYLVSGHLAFDAPFQYQIIASQYRYTGNLDINSIDLEGKSLAAVVLTFALRDPGFVAGFVLNHFLATQVGGLLALPLIEPFNGLLAPINMYWLGWAGDLSWFNLLLVILYLAIIALGLGAAWRRFRWAAFVPVAFSVGYALANGLGRFSGWRYDLPADWISYFFFGVGAAQLMAFAATVFGAANGRIFSFERQIGPTRVAPAGLLAVLPFILLGALPWLAEGVAAPRYAGESPAVLLRRLETSPAVQHLDAANLQVDAFASTSGSVVEVGRALYPRYFSKDDGLASAHPWPAYAPRDFPRLGFLLLNEFPPRYRIPASPGSDRIPGVRRCNCPGLPATGLRRGAFGSNP